ncbi:MAG: SoxZ [Methylibium sp. NZG]|nr:MAG: SoxZ [Methylibium sp. NZG]
MTPSPIRIRARLREGLTDVQVLMPHPMETGLRADAAGQLVAVHHITDVQVSVAGRPVLSARMSMAVSQDPLLSFRFKGGLVGDRVSVAWTDTRGERRTDEIAIS